MMRKWFKLAMQGLLASALVVPFGGSVSDAVAAPTETVVYHETFASGSGLARPSGGASLAQVTGKAFAGNDDGAALYVGNRMNNWDAADFAFSDVGMENGKTYTVTVTVYVDADVAVPEGAQAYLQTVDQTYGWLAGADFKAGEAFALTKEFILDTASGDTRLRVQSNDAGAAVPFYIGDIRITENGAAGGEEPRPPAQAFAAVTFEDRTAGGFAGRSGTETLTVTDEANHTAGGAYALKVEGREATWHGPSLRVEPYVDKGYEYTVTAWVKLISPDSSQLQLSTQVGNGSGANYVNLAAQTIRASDDWVKYEGTYRYNSVGDEYLTIYVESANNATASFYIDDISFVRSGSGPIAIQTDLTPIKEAYRNEFLIGNAITAEDFEGPRLDLLKMHHNAATAGNAMKPDALQKTKGVFTFDDADAMVDRVLDEGMKMHGHVLVWHQQSPAWLNTTQDEQGNAIPLGRDEALDNLTTHIRTVMEHFGDKVISWDVVNEAMSDNPSDPSDWRASLRQSPWFQAIGPDYLEQAFLAAREVLDAHPDWQIKLYYNDYNEDNQNKAAAIYHMVKELNEDYAETHPGKLLIDGVGMQGHYNIHTNPDNVKLSLEKFLSLGVTVSVSELDIQAGSDGQLPENIANAQGYLYAQLMDIFKAHAAQIERVTFWGMDDGTSWRSSSNPLLFDKNLQAKPAYYGVIDPETFMAAHEPDSKDALRSVAEFGTPVIDGAPDAVWNDAPAMPLNRYQTAWQGATGTAKALWDRDNLYVLLQVSDSQLDKANPNAWEQDSVEVFVDENNGKTSFYQDDDGQYRVNFDNEASFNPAGFAEGFESATQVSGSNYTVELKIPFRKTTPVANRKIGFDAQVNDANDGARQSVAAWNDTTGTGYMDTSVFGILTLNDGSASGGGGDGDGGGGMPTEPDNPPANPGEVNADVDADGNATATVGADDMKKAIAIAKGGTVNLRVQGTENAKRVTVTIPIEQVKAAEEAGAKRIEVASGLAAVQLPLSLFDNASGTANVELHVGKADPSTLPDETKAKIGSNPVYDFALRVDGQTVSDFRGGPPVKVGVPYTLKPGENPGQIIVYYLADNGRLEIVKNGRYDKESGMVWFHAKHFSKYAAAANSVAFGDTDGASAAKDSIESLAARGIVVGVAPNAFAPDRPVSRAEFIQMIVQALDLRQPGATSTFADVKPGAWYYASVASAQMLGIAAALPGGAFGPNDPISRQEMAALASRALEKAGLSTDAVTTDDRLDPQGKATRAEAAVVVYRMLNP